MNPPTHAKTGFGLVDTRKKVASRVRRNRDRVENAPRLLPPMSLSPESAAHIADLFRYARQFKHPLAA